MKSLTETGMNRILPPAGDGKIPFPTQDAPEFAKVTMGAKSCPPSPMAKR